MLTDFMTLGLQPGATDEQIRMRYLDLVKANPPEKDAQRFQDISNAYENLKDRHARIRRQLFACRDSADVQGLLDYLARAAKPTRRRAGLQALLKSLNGSS